MKESIEAKNYFSQPDEVLALLAWLRLVAMASLLLMLGLASWFDVMVIERLLVGSWAASSMLVGVCLSAGSWLLIGRIVITRQHVFYVLLADTTAWFLLVSATGGMINPAVSYALVLLSVAALSLPLLQAAFVMMLMIGLYTWLMGVTGAPVHDMQMMQWHLWGMWLLFVFNSIVLLGVMVVLNKMIREKDYAISAYREETVRSEQLVVMGALAANLAHEMGTPLSTIAMLAEEKNNEDGRLIQQQVERCKLALMQLKTLDLSSRGVKRKSSSEFLGELKQQALLSYPERSCDISDDVNKDVWVSALLKQAVMALLMNAVKAAGSSCRLSMSLKGKYLLVDILHDGEPVSDELLKVLGVNSVDSSSGGVGVGYYLANASIEQLGGALKIRNEEAGVLTRIEFLAESVIAEGSI